MIVLDRASISLIPIVVVALSLNLPKFLLFPLLLWYFFLSLYLINKAKKIACKTIRVYPLKFLFYFTVEGSQNNHVIHTYRCNLIVLLRLNCNWDLCENKSRYVCHNLDSQKMNQATGISHIICESKNVYSCSAAETITHWK